MQFVKNIFKKSKKPIEHKHLILRVETAFSPKGEVLEDWIAETIKRMGMECINGPHVDYVADEGNVGPTGVAILSTSHMAVHIWTEPEGHDLWQVDFYTCGEMDVDTVVSMLSIFKIQKIEMKLLDRETGLVEIEV